MKPSTILTGIAALVIGFLVGGALMGTNWVAVADPGLEWVFVVIGFAFLSVPYWLFSQGHLNRLARWLISILAVATALGSLGIGFIVYFFQRHPIS